MAEEIEIRSELVRLYVAKPFAAFDIIMASGDRYAVGARDAIAVGQGIVTYLPARGGQSYLRVMFISSVDISDAD